MDQIIREAIDIELQPNNINRGDEFSLGSYGSLSHSHLEGMNESSL
jgi:hypothetical protein